MRVLDAVGIIELRPLREVDAKGELIAPGMEADGDALDAAAE